MIGGNRGKIVDFLQDQRARGNITSDICYRTWLLIGGTTHVQLGTIDGVKVGRVEIHATADERVDTDAALCLLRTLSAQPKDGTLRIEAELVDGRATKRVHATCSAASASRLRGKC